MKPAGKLRTVFVPKNRLGANRFEPFPLELDEHGFLKKSAHINPSATMAYGWSSRENKIVDVQAVVRLPKLNERPKFNAQKVPKEKLHQLVDVIQRMPYSMYIGDLEFTVQCHLPGKATYEAIMDLPLVVSVVSSYLLRSASRKALFVGEVDLVGNIRPIDQDLLSNLVETVGEEYVQDPSIIQTVYLSEQNARDLRLALVAEGVNVKLEVVRTVSHALSKIWPELFS
jgi:predicted ATP-dependent serine protease